MDQENRLTSLIWPVMALIAVLGIGLLQRSPPIASPRPATKADVGTDAGSDGVARSRLWEDPLRVAAGVGGAPRSADRVQLPRGGLPAASSVRILIVTLDGAPWAEIVSRRIGTRYAVHAAMSVAGYQVADDQHLGLWKPRCDRVSGWFSRLVSSPLDVECLPYEWFLPEAAPAPPTLVLWLKEPRHRGAEVLRHIKQQCTRDLGPREAITHVVGPTNSDVLAQWVRAGVLATLAGHERVFSCWATADDTSLGLTADNPDRHRVRRVIGEDNALLPMLVEELRRRRVDPRRGDRMAILSERDTLYGRRLAAALLPDGPTRPSACTPARYTYLRGLDGEFAGTATPDAAAAVRTPTSLAQALGEIEKAGRPQGIERPDGTGQIDYVRRLVAQLQSDERQQGKLRAIGILGTDVYDKLMLLAALRPSFPEAVFFTTDLDARLLHPADRRFTRNLVVASHFDLELGDVMQDCERPAPFRDGYQTAVFLGCLLALDHGPTTQSLTAAPVGRLFEIGQHGAFALDVSRSGEKAAYYPRGPREHPVWTPFAWLLVLLAAALVAVLLAQALPRMGSQPSHAGRHFVLLVGIPWSVGWLAIWDSYQPDGEPFELASGLSVWPSVILRAFTTVLAIWLVHRASHHLQQHPEVLPGAASEPAKAADVILEPRPAQPRPAKAPSNVARSMIPPALLLPSMLAFDLGAVLGMTLLIAAAAFGMCCGLLSAVRGRLSWPIFGAKDVSILGWRCPGEARVDVPQLLKDYEHRGRLESRLQRTLVIMAVYLALTTMMFAVEGLPFAPTRGRVSFGAHIASTVLAVAASIVLVLFVWDATRLCQRFVKNLTVRDSAWPPELLGLKKAASSEHHVLRELARATLLDVRIIGRRTEAVGRIIPYPFVILLLMVVARHRSIDNWPWTWALVGVMGLGLAVALVSAATLWQTARKARLDELGHLRSLLDQQGSDSRSTVRKEIEATIQQIEGVKTGAYAGLVHNPIVAALLLPAGGIGLLELLPLLVAG